MNCICILLHDTGNRLLHLTDTLPPGTRIQTLTGSAAAVLPWFAVLVCSFLLSCSAENPEGFDFKIAVEQDGMVRVEFDALAYTGPQPDTELLTLTERGRLQSFAVDDGGDGKFGPGDSLSFLGRHLPGEHSWFDPWSVENIYRLRLRSQIRESESTFPDPASGTDTQPAPGPESLTRHYESEELRVSLPESDEATREAWYWRRLSHMDRKPFVFTLPAGKRPEAVRVSMTGLSTDQSASAAGIPQHHVDLYLDGQLVGSQEWNGQASSEIVIQAPALAELWTKPAGSSIKLELKVPERPAADASNALIDVVLLNWIEVDYPSEPGLEQLSFASPGGDRRYLVEPGSHDPVRITPFREAGLRVNDVTADYLIIAHGSLLEAIAPLAEFHRQRGLKVAVIDVEHIYNEFNHGIVSPFAIRDFIRQASNAGKMPAPRYVLLVGDASFNVRDASTQRNLIPSMMVATGEELAASDNGFVTIHGDDKVPDLAIGRIPVADADELSVVVEKLLAYAASPSNEPWQRRVTLISDASDHFQKISDRIAAGLDGQDLQVDTLYPGEVTDTASQDQDALIGVLNSGQLLVHFLGHGGRFVWRTGPPDYKNASDLFKDTDLQQLQNGNKLPLVLSMTCSSGPFDHPQASSIAEEFLLLPGNGAVGVLAASWRVPASRSFSALLLEELLKPGHGVGEAILKAKQKEPRLSLIESYNFLGDPAMQLKLPETNQPSGTHSQ